jgi:hypothetical protein
MVFESCLWRGLVLCERARVQTTQVSFNRQREFQLGDLRSVEATRHDAKPWSNVKMPRFFRLTLFCLQERRLQVVLQVLARVRCVARQRVGCTDFEFDITNALGAGAIAELLTRLRI